ncbi:hypothetical protein DFH09DRAFT_1083614 [Mycena vulgaris]|nr:hypothetical protein DFH09DRAFT_1083614 [Mycena vulgaris]
MAMIFLRFVADSALKARISRSRQSSAYTAQSVMWGDSSGRLHDGERQQAAGKLPYDHRSDTTTWPTPATLFLHQPQSRVESTRELRPSSAQAAGSYTRGIRKVAQKPHAAFEEIEGISAGFVQPHAALRNLSISSGPAAFCGLVVWKITLEFTVNETAGNPQSLRPPGQWDHNSNASFPEDRMAFEFLRFIRIWAFVRSIHRHRPARGIQNEANANHLLLILLCAIHWDLHDLLNFTVITTISPYGKAYTTANASSPSTDFEWRRKNADYRMSVRSKWVDDLAYWQKYSLSVESTSATK